MYTSPPLADLLDNKFWLLPLYVKLAQLKVIELSAFPILHDLLPDFAL